MEFEDFKRELLNEEFKEVDDLDIQIYPNKEDKIRILDGSGRVLFRLIKRDTEVNESIKRNIDKIKKINRIKEKLNKQEEEEDEELPILPPEEAF